jgi:non-canonical (house-cleaning) NTP pyrophosphatase
MGESIKTNSRLELIKVLEGLNLPNSIIVTSASAIKIEIVKKAMKILFPKQEFNIVGVKAVSGVNEQPVGKDETELGANNRIASAEGLVEKSTEPRAFISVENGIFKITDKQYEDRAVVVIKLPDGQVYSATSPRGVIFPIEAVEVTRSKIGGFKNNTVGSTIAEMFFHN